MGVRAIAEDFDAIAQELHRLQEERAMNEVMQKQKTQRVRCAACADAGWIRWRGKIVECANCGNPLHRRQPLS